MSDIEIIRAKLEESRRSLLDLTARNRLLNTPRGKARSGRLDIVEEATEEVFRILVRDGKRMTFLPRQGTEESESQQQDLFRQPEDTGRPSDHLTDLKLQTSLGSEPLQRKLLALHRDARTLYEEQGVSILYLACGFLKWYEDLKSDKERYAPLILIPVELTRESAASRFKLSYSGEDITTNLSLQEKLKLEFGMQLPEIPDIEDFNLSEYFDQVSSQLTFDPRWEVQRDDMVLWFFSFAKLLMYRDLEAASWPDNRSVLDHGLVSSLLTEGFRGDGSICSEDDFVDQFLVPENMVHVKDADSSQAIAIEEIRLGKNLVIQGPPGTGKSQTITNVIATAVKEGKRVLFVAEKMAALDVVKRRLDDVGLGDMCLELHSHKANKRNVLQDLSATLNLKRPRIEDTKRQAEELQFFRDRLNRHVQEMHEPIGPSEVSTYRALGEIVRLRSLGVETVDFGLDQALTWTPAETRQVQDLLNDLVVQLQDLGNPKTHPWRGVGISSILPTDRDRLMNRLTAVLEKLNDVTQAAQELAGQLSYDDISTAVDASHVGVFANELLKAPEMDRQALVDPVWSEGRDSIDDVLHVGQSLSTELDSLRGIVAEIAWETDVRAARRSLAAHGQSFFRWFKRDYRDALALLRGIVETDLPNTNRERVRLLDSLIRAQKSREKFEDGAELAEIGRRAFGSLWKDVETDWDACSAITQWEQHCRDAKLPTNFRDTFANLDDPSVLRSGVQTLSKHLKPLIEELKAVSTDLSLDVVEALGSADVKLADLDRLAAVITTWLFSAEKLSKWITYRSRLQRLRECGLTELADQLNDGLISSDAAVDSFRMAYFESLLREAFQRYPDLAEFDGASHEKLLERFRDLDRQRLEMSIQEVALAHHSGLPTGSGDLGEVGVIRREIKKKSRHMPIRKLLVEGGHAIQATKPVFMMSPMSVAQYLQPGILEFDLLLIDEASQVRPVDALGAIARSKQMVVVGDDRQLPPTQFFSSVLEADDEDEDDTDLKAADMESILGLCEAQSMPQRMLRWHYRSRHESLIAVSNKEFYGSRLYVVPSPETGQGEIGLKFHHIAHGVFDRGKSTTNRAEAEAIADAVMGHARKYSTPDQKSLGIGAFSVRQRDAILDEIELRRRQHPELERFFLESGAEPFFVKNLENIQGDERDVIFISVGYGRDDSGYMSMSFGPLNREGGERRLNVLISRAKERCEVFSSIVAEDIDLNRTKARGAQALKTFLKFAEHRIIDVATATDRGFDSEFEIQVAEALTRHGYDVKAQVGVAGFFIDLAIVDPDNPGRYVIAIECDGATYHSSRSARDRDRLRQQVLEDRGWTIHRIWSTDWFHRPDEQLEKTVQAIEAARSSPRQTPAEQSLVEEEHRPLVVRFDEDFEPEAPRLEAVPYAIANFQINVNSELHETPPHVLAQVVSKVVELEGPIHRDEVARRTATLWGLKRTGKRISEAVDTALAEAAYRDQVDQVGMFFMSRLQPDIAVRDRSDVEMTSVRKPEYLPPMEIEAAVKAIVDTHHGVSSDEVISTVARLLGFKSTSAGLRDVISDQIQMLLAERKIESRNEKLYTVTDDSVEFAG